MRARFLIDGDYQEAEVIRENPKTILVKVRENILRYGENYFRERWIIRHKVKHQVEFKK